jgi:RNA polymerase sigma-70 factor, ECF subfamily
MSGHEMSGIFPNPQSAVTSQLEQHHNDCYGWALYCCNRDREKASEILQTAYLKILEKQHTFRGASTFKTWLFIVIKNTALDALREQRKREKKMVGGLVAWHAVYESSSESRLEEKQRSAFFLEAINRLSERQRQLMQLVFYHDFSINQAAEVLHLSSGSARQHYHRAKKVLADWFRQNGVDKIK